MHELAVPAWTMLPFVALVLGIASLPVIAPELWSRRSFQALVTACCALPVAASLLLNAQGAELLHALREYAAFVCMLTALYVTAGGFYVTADLEATPRVNLGFLLIGSVLASAIGTTGASILVLRPLLRTNSERENRAHLVPFFILAVANAGGMLTPLGDPPLLVGFIQGVPFFWTLRLWPIWLLYVGTFALMFYVVDRRAYARESRAARRADREQVAPFVVRGTLNLLWLCAIVSAAFLPAGWRELALIAIAAASYFGTPREVHRLNDFSFHAMAEIAVLFAGLFTCLVPLELGLAAYAHAIPVHASWQMFWASGVLSSFLDNAPTYAAFCALARTLSPAGAELVAGITPIKLAAISAGSVVMGATTYIGNGPNLMIKAIAERSHYVMPSFVRYAVFAFVAMLPAHLIVTAAFILLER